MKKQNQDQELAERFACSTRSIRRMRSKGIDLTNPLAIVDFIIESRAATPAQLNACMAVVLIENQKQRERAANNEPDET